MIGLQYIYKKLFCLLFEKKFIHVLSGHYQCVFIVKSL